MENNDNINYINYINEIEQEERNIYHYINNLPNEIKSVIQEYIPYSSLVFTNKDNYINYHYLLRFKLKENYTRDIVRRDFDFVFERILNENYKKWLMTKHYMYKNIIYGNYIYFLKDFCLMNESYKCRMKLNNFLEENGLCKNQHKKNTSKHIRWKN